MHPRVFISRREHNAIMTSIYKIKNKINKFILTSPKGVISLRKGIISKKETIYLQSLTNDQQKITLLLKWIRGIKTTYPIISCISNVKHLKEHMSHFIAIVINTVINHGAVEAMKRFKSFRLRVQQECLRQPITTIPYLKTDRSGFPKILKFWKPDIKCVKSMRYCISVMRIPEVFSLPVNYNINTITDPSTAKAERLSDICDFITKWEGIKTLGPLKASKTILSNKVGPNGPASISAMKDLYVLRKNFPELLDCIKQLFKISAPYINIDNYTVPEFETERISKLAFLADKMGKTRVIAIGDWWSNQALLCIHNEFMKALNRLPGDVTYHQDKIPKFINEFGRSLYSSDMTAFTDRLPTLLLEKVVETAYGSSISRLWKTILVDRPFQTHDKSYVRYAVGNPMGFLSSWAVSSFTHHAIKAYCAFKVFTLNSARIRPRDYKFNYNYKYLVLGDDTLDTNSTVYDYYTHTMRELGLSISVNKCTVSELGFAEFAKRLFTPYGEITGIPVTLISGFQKKPEQFLEFVRILIDRGYQYDDLTSVIDTLLSENPFRDSKIMKDLLYLTQVTKAPEENPWGNFDISPELREFSGLDVSTKNEFLAIARNYIFWNVTVRKYTKISANLDQLQSNEHLTPTHPLVLALYQKIEAYLPEESFDSEGNEDEYYIYNQWVLGNLHLMADLPSINTYRYKDRDERLTKCNFDIYKSLLKLIKGDTSICLINQVKLSNYDLYNKCFDELQELFKVKTKNSNRTFEKVK